MSDRLSKPASSEPARGQGRRTWWIYGLAVALPALAALARAGLDNSYGPLLLLMFAPILIVAFVGGLWPGLLSTVLSAAASWFLVLPRSHSPRFSDRVDWLILILEGVVITILSERLHRAKRSAEVARTALLSRVLLLNQTYDAVLIWDWNGPITFWNSGAETLYGFREQDAVGRLSHTLLATTHAEGMSKVLDELDRNGKWEGELCHTTSDGRRLSVDSRMQLVRESSGWFVVEANRDATAMKAAHVDVVQTEERFKTAFRLSPLGKILVRLADDKIVEVNDAYAEILGCSFSEIVGCTLAGHNPLVDPEALRQVRAALGAGRALMNVEVQFHRKNGLTGSGILYAELLGGGPDPHALIVLHDVTMRQRAEDELRLANLDLQQFAFVAAHDLQEPARNVSTALGLFRRNYQSVLDTEGAQLIQESIDAAKRMHRMIRDLLELTKADNTVRGHVRQAPSTDCDEILRQVAENLKQHIISTGAEIVAAGLPPVAVQPTHVLQLFQNLIGNAIKYRRDGVPPRVCIEARLEASTWTFSVADNGIGFDAAFTEQIFGVFKRLHQASDYPGNGIGLAICERIVRLYGGRIRAVAQPGEGATFYFSLPAASSVARSAGEGGN